MKEYIKMYVITNDDFCCEVLNKIRLQGKWVYEWYEVDGWIEPIERDRKMIVPDNDAIIEKLFVVRKEKIKEFKERFVPEDYLKKMEIDMEKAGAVVLPGFPEEHLFPKLI